MTNGLSPRRVSVLVSTLMAAAGLKGAATTGISGPALRHSAAADTLEQNHDIRAVQEMLGHVHLSSTEI